jgi:hypothetical protein
MSAWNLGLAPAFQQARRESTPIMGEGDYQAKENAWLGDWQGRWNAATPVATGPSRWDMIQQGTQDAGGYFLTGDKGAADPFTNMWQSDGNAALNSYATGAFNGDGTDPSYLINALGQDRFNQIANYQPTMDDSARRGLESERDRQMAQFNLDRQTRQQNQQAQQQSYNAMNGGGYAGGIIDEGYSSPWSTGSSSLSDPTQATPGSTFGQPWATPGYGGESGGQAIGGYTRYTRQSQGGLGGLGGMPNQTQGGGMGGPFSNSNPWAPSS